MYLFVPQRERKPPQDPSRQDYGALRGVSSSGFLAPMHFARRKPVIALLNRGRSARNEREAAKRLSKTIAKKLRACGALRAGSLRFQ
jgi:hypothetical protein